MLFRSQMTQHMLTANRLSDGAVVYLGYGGGWSGEIQNGQLVAADKTEELEAEGQRAAAANIIVASYVIEVEGTEGNYTPVRRREQIRAFGPTVVKGAQTSQGVKDLNHVPV